MSKQIKVIFFGDIVGKYGRKALGDYLRELKTDNNPPVFSIANVENASHGFGLTEKNYKELSNYGLDCMTSGNHIWDKGEILTYINSADKLIRPINYPKGTKGVGSRVFEFDGYKIAVINVLGRIFMPVVDSPWDIVKKEIKKLKKITPNIIIDFHTEATAEKVCFGRFCSELGVSAVLGTHTHIQTADEKLINDTAYITDVGFCGVYESVIGMDYKSSLKRLSTGLPVRHEIPKLLSDKKSRMVQINATEVLIDAQTGRALDIKRVVSIINY